MKITVTESRVLGEEWEKTELHCPQCGERSVWCESPNRGPYASLKDRHACLACSAFFWLGIAVCDPDGTTAARLEALRKAA
jgi:predicted RNA-binding Zn-ribbon protein involved in translation (DUF1610 family)